MSFVLRQIARRTGAPDIVRIRAIEAAEPVIGRGTDCDIQLPDLAVNLRHAVLRPMGRGRVTVEGINKASFEVDGAFTRRAELVLARTPALGFGNHVLTLTTGDAADEIIVTMTARENAPETVAAADQHDAFSLKTSLFSQRKLAWIAGVLILALCLALPVTQFFLARQRITAVSANPQWSSGPLTPGHHFLEGNCEACHQQAFVAVRDSACLACHRDGLNEAAAMQLASDMRAAGSRFAPSPAGDHAPADRLWQASPASQEFGKRAAAWFSRTFDHPNNRCASCHTEHVGSGKGAEAPPPVTPDELTRNDCESCHATLTQRLADTRLPNVPDWGHHPEFRPLVTVALNQRGQAKVEQIALSARPQEQTGLKFSHQVHLLANGGVARMAVELGGAQGYGAPLACANCHRPDGKSFAPIEMTRDCAACHSLAFARQSGVLQMLPHGQPEKVVATLQAFYAQGGGFSPDTGGLQWRPGPLQMRETRPSLSPAERVRQGVQAAFSPGGTCYDCHTVIAPAAGSVAFGVAPVRLTQRYLPHGAFDHDIPAHRQDAAGKPACALCHQAESSTKAEDVLLPSIAQCAACHGKAKDETAQAASADCAECHGFHDTGRQGAARTQFAEASKP